MVWKSGFFWWFMRFVRVPPYESWENRTNFLSSWENGDFFWGQTCCTLFHTQNEEKSQKISTRIRIHTRVYANTWWWGQICPPPSRIRVQYKHTRNLVGGPWEKVLHWGCDPSHPFKISSHSHSTRRCNVKLPFFKSTVHPLPFLVFVERVFW